MLILGLDMTAHRKCKPLVIPFWPFAFFAVSAVNVVFPVFERARRHPSHIPSAVFLHLKFSVTARRDINKTDFIVVVSAQQLFAGA